MIEESLPVAGDVTVHSGSVISGNNVQLAAETSSRCDNCGRMALNRQQQQPEQPQRRTAESAGGGLNLERAGDINIGATISGKTVGLESVAGSINNITRAQQWNVAMEVCVHFSGTDVGKTASITATDGLTMRAGQDIQRDRRKRVGG